MSPEDLAALVKQEGSLLGFAGVGIAAAAPFGRADYIHRWLAHGRAGTMDYLHRNVELRCDPRRLFPGARSVIVVAWNYRVDEPSAPVEPPSSLGRASAIGRVARYAWGRDYHVVVKDRLHGLLESIRRQVKEPFQARVCVDTVPILERELAMAAGIGWIGKNTLVLHETLGSYFVLGEVVTSLDIAPDPPAVDHCGSCRRCLDACPTRAFPAPYQMDASRCISYLTIEHRGTIPAEFHGHMADWVFGCDICQEVCPFNRESPMSTDPDVQSPSAGPHLPLNDLPRWTAGDYARATRDRALNRATLDMLKRNGEIALGNSSPARP